MYTQSEHHSVDMNYIQSGHHSVDMNYTQSGHIYIYIVIIDHVTNKLKVTHMCVDLELGILKYKLGKKGS